MIETVIANLGVRRLTSARRSTHQQMVDAFMSGANQDLPVHPLVPKEEVRVLRAKLIFEEAMETINALGVGILVRGAASSSMEEGQEFQTCLNQPYQSNSRFQAESGEKFDLAHSEDGASSSYWTDGDLEYEDRGLHAGPLDELSKKAVPGKLLEEDDGWVAGHSFAIAGPCNLREVVDGCLDVKVVTTGTLSAFGVADEALQLEVDSNNLRKFAEGHTIRGDGKLVKPPNHPAPRIMELINAQCEDRSPLEK